jgi:steroid 5-alpha reductase family enzyme
MAVSYLEALAATALSLPADAQLRNFRELPACNNRVCGAGRWLPPQKGVLA